MGGTPGRWTAALTAALLLVAPAAVHAKRSSGPAAKLGGALAELAAADARGQSVAAAADARGLTVTPGERVLVEVVAGPGQETTRARLAQAGAEVLATAPGPGGLTTASAWVLVDELETVAGAAGVRAVLPVQAGGTDAGAGLSQGDGAHNGPAARLLGATGAGVKVGIISDSIDQRRPGLAGSQASGDLPADVTVLSDHAGQSDEGRAMAEIVYDTAPGITEMAFASGTSAGPTGKAAAIDALVAAGAKVIADDIFWLSEPFFQDGAVSQAVDRARAAGVLYLASAGNRARQSYESAPRFDGVSGLHDFDPGAATDATQTLAEVPHASFVEVVLQWDEAWGAARTDIDLRLVRADTGATLAAAESNNLTVGRVPREIASWRNETGGPVTVAVQIRRFTAEPGAPAPTTLKYIARGDFGTFSIAEHDTASDTINPDAAGAAGALAVAAVAWNQPGFNVPRRYSSRGPRTRLFDRLGTRLAVPEVRQKPELAAADGVSTTVAGFQPFSGTSAAAPSAAGVAALVQSAKPLLPLSLLRAIMTDARNTADCAAPGLPDPDCGWGFVFADRAVAQALDTTGPVVQPVVSPAPGPSGWSAGDVRITEWTVTDPQSPAERLSCPPAALTVDGATTASCQARSAGGTTTARTTLRRDATPPDVPVISGIAATGYTPETVPPASAISCSSRDALSGLAGCAVGGYRADPGTHTLTAVAADLAGNTRTETLRYTVAAPPQQAAAPAPPPVPRVRVRDLVTLPAARACVRPSRRLRVRVAKPRVGAVRRVRIRMTGVRRALTGRHGTFTLPRLTRARVTVRVTVTLTDGRSATVRRTYRRC